MKLKAAKFAEETPRTVFSTDFRFEMPLGQQGNPFKKGLTGRSEQGLAAAVNARIDMTQEMALLSWMTTC